MKIISYNDYLIKEHVKQFLFFIILGFGFELSASHFTSCHKRSSDITGRGPHDLIPNSTHFLTNPPNLVKSGPINKVAQHPGTQEIISWWNSLELLLTNPAHSDHTYTRPWHGQMSLSHSLQCNYNYPEVKLDRYKLHLTTFTLSLMINVNMWT